ncbi:MAG: hypothetical protein GYB68_13885 [Chloroflexi bacterium]|nr:hypothetical protein [Chloroflexota bacterium]
MAYLLRALLLLLVVPVAAQDEGLFQPEPLAVVGAYGSVESMAWSPDGSTLAVSTPNGVLLLDDRLNVTAVLRDPAGGVQGVQIVWNADGTLLAEGRGIKRTQILLGTRAFVWEIATGEPRHIVEEAAELRQIRSVWWGGDRAIFFHVSDVDDTPDLLSGVGF